MTGVDPVAHDDRLLDDLIAGRATGDPLLDGLAAWRTDVMASPPGAGDPAADRLTAVSRAPGRAGWRVGPVGARRVRPVDRRRAHRGRATRPAPGVRRATELGVGVVVLLAMGVSQAVAGSPVAPLTYVVGRAVGLGEEVATPRTAKRHERPNLSAPAVTGSEVHTGRSGAEALSSAHKGEASHPVPSRDGRSRADSPRAEQPATPAPSPVPGVVTTAPAPADDGTRDRDWDRDRDGAWDRDRGGAWDGDRDGDRDRDRDRSGDQWADRSSSWRPSYVVR
ncbi:hypothetical protein [Mumia sp.]|uniref:hypothetical protein n=1 Tax=Mumia sp. TaxID=1965300 RepID=UPI00260C184F|nr:hypothetical protein [Mumia sp.]MDD9349763.1 hypothetical protein [Mumia sp.]